MPQQTAINYSDQLGSLYQPGVEGQTPLSQTQGQIDAESYFVAIRNYRNVNEVPIDKPQVYLNFIAKKIMVKDSELLQIDSNDFVFYADEIIPDPDPFFLPDGMLYRCLGEPLKDLRDYKYYVRENGISKRIPDYKSVEVELGKRGISYTTVQVLTEAQCNDLKGSAGSGGGGSEPLPAASSAGQWTEDLGNTTGYNTLANLSANLGTLEGLISGLSTSAAAEQANIANDLAAQAAGMQASEAAAAASSAAANAAQSSATSAQSSAAAQASSAQASAASAAASATAAANAATLTQAQADAALAVSIAAEIALANTQNSGG